VLLGWNKKTPDQLYFQQISIRRIFLYTGYDTFNLNSMVQITIKKILVANQNHSYFVMILYFQAAKAFYY